MKGLSQPFTDQNGLCGMFQQHNISSNQRRRHRIDSRHIGIIPWRNHQHCPMRHAFYIALKFIAVLDSNGGQTVRSNIRHIAGTLLKAAKFTAIADRPPNLPCQFPHNIFILLANDSDRRPHQIDAFGKWARRPFSLRRMRLGNGFSGRRQR